MEMFVWLVIFILYVMIVSTKSDIKQLQFRLQQLEQQKLKITEEKTAIQEQKPFQPPLPPTAKPQPAPTITPSHLQTAASSAATKNQNINFLGQKLISWIAGFAAVLGFFYFVRYSIENGLLTPAARMIVATASGAVLVILGSLILYKKKLANYQTIGEVLNGTGIAAFYFAAYASSQIYQLISQETAFALMCLTTIVSIALTLIYKGKVTAVLALIGGFLTPALALGAKGNIIEFCLYMFIFTSAILFIGKWLVCLWLVMLALCGLYIWLFVWLFLFFVDFDSAWMFILGVGISLLCLSMFRKEDGKVLRIISQAFCITFAFAALIKTDFGMFEWGIVGILLLGLNALYLFEHKNYASLLYAATAAVFMLILGSDGNTNEKQIIIGSFGIITLLPSYIMLWFKRQKEFVTLPTVCAPLIYALAYYILPDGIILPCLGLITALAFAILVIRFDLNDDRLNHCASHLILSAAAVSALACADLFKIEFWPIIVTVELIVLVSLQNNFHIKKLEKGIGIAAALLAILEAENIVKITGLLFFAPILEQAYLLKNLTPDYYWSYLLIPACGLAYLAYITKTSTARVLSSVCSGLLILFAVFSFHMQIKMQIAHTTRIQPTFTDCAIITNLLLLGALGYAYTRRSAFSWITAAGLWRLFIINILFGSPFFNRITLSWGEFAFTYAVPMAIFAVTAWKENKANRTWWTYMTALSSFVLVSGILTLAFYQTLYLDGINFTDSGIFAYSAAWLLLGCLWLIIALKETPLIKPAFALIYFVIAKVFIYDVSSLDGIWRISALFGLAGSLLVISYVYSRWFQPKLNKEDRAEEKA